MSYPTDVETIHTYRVRVHGYGTMFVRAISRGRARYLIATCFSDAGLGTIMEGLREIVSCCRDAEADVELLYPRRGPEGLCLETWRGRQLPSDLEPLNRPPAPVAP